MRTVTGIGWWTPEASGCMLSGREHDPKGREVFTSEFRNFGRLDHDSRAAAYAVALALKDAGLGYPLGPDLTAGITAAGPSGCLASDLAYFGDYVECGRTLGRGNLFIYTLPTSPLAECAIHFGLEGPVLFTGGAGSVFARPMEAASESLEETLADLMLAGVFSQEGALFMVVAKDAAVRPGGAGLGYSDLMDVLMTIQDGRFVTGAVSLIQNLMRERGINAAV